MKKKVLALFICVSMLAVAVVGGTMAYFTDVDEATNTFTAGNVEIDLTEAVVAQDTNNTSSTYGWMLPTDIEKDRWDVGDQDAENDPSGSSEDVYDYGKMYPGQWIYKDPRIENTGSELAYVAAKVTVTSEGNLHEILGIDAEYPYDIFGIDTNANGEPTGLISRYNTTYEEATLEGLSGLECDDYFVYIQAEGDGFVLYFFVTNPLLPPVVDAGEDEIAATMVTLFDTICVPAVWDNAEMAELVGLEIHVEAYATQEYGFSDCYTAITTAFDGVFPEYSAD